MIRSEREREFDALNKHLAKTQVESKRGNARDVFGNWYSVYVPVRVSVSARVSISTRLSVSASLARVSVSVRVSVSARASVSALVSVSASLARVSVPVRVSVSARVWQKRESNGRKRFWQKTYQHVA